jgi:hypothetical protein
VHHTERSETPRWAEPLRPVHICVGLARWMLNAFSYSLPRVPDETPAPYRVEGHAQLPTRAEDSAYWAHFDWLLRESKTRTTKARITHAQ